MITDFINLFFPIYCLICQTSLLKNEKFICLHCFYKLPQTNYHLVYDNPVAQKFYGKVLVKNTMAVYKFKKTGIVQKLLEHLKYKNQPMIGKIIGKEYGKLIKNTAFSKTFDLIVPVPLHIEKIYQRGYNQSSFFAKGLSQALQIPWNDQCLKRSKKTATQTNKSRIERWKNVQHSFVLNSPALINEKHILLVDDVVTTGATLEACSTLLLHEGSKAVSVATIAVAE